MIRHAVQSIHIIAYFQSFYYAIINHIGHHNCKSQDCILVCMIYHRFDISGLNINTHIVHIVASTLKQCRQRLSDIYSVMNMPFVFQFVTDDHILFQSLAQINIQTWQFHISFFNLWKALRAGYHQSCQFKEYSLNMMKWISCQIWIAK